MLGSFFVLYAVLCFLVRYLQRTVGLYKSVVVVLDVTVLALLVMMFE